MNPYDKPVSITIEINLSKRDTIQATLPELANLEPLVIEACHKAVAGYSIGDSLNKAITKNIDSEVNDIVFRAIKETFADKDMKQRIADEVAKVVKIRLGQPVVAAPAVEIVPSVVETLIESAEQAAPAVETTPIVDVSSPIIIAPR